jgi:hypothetical protein
MMGGMMDRLTTGPPMAKRNDVTVKMDADVVKDAKVVAALKGLSLAEYLTEVVRPVVAEEFEKELAKRAKASGTKGKKKSGPETRS